MIELSQISVLPILLLFYISLSSSNKTLPHQMQKLLEENDYVYHIFNILRLFMSIILLGKVSNVFMAGFMTLIGYIWFIGTLKLDLKWNIFVFIIMFVGFIYDMVVSESNEKLLENESLSDDEKKMLKEHHGKIRLYFVITLFSITLFGTIIYAIRKKTQYGDSFDIFKFFVTRPNS